MDLIYNYVYIYIYTSSTRTRRAGSCLRDIYIYKTFLIYRTCMRVRQRNPWVRAFCESGVLLHMSHLKSFKAPLRTSHFSLRSSHSTLHTALFALNTSLHTALLRLRASHFTLHSPHFALLTAFFTSHSTLHTALFTPHTPHCTLHTPHFISSELFSPYPNSSLLISFLLICHLSFHESLPSTTTKELACTVRQPGPLACFVRSCCSVVVQEDDLRTTPAQCNAKQTLSSHFTLHSSHPTLRTSQLHFISTHLI